MINKTTATINDTIQRFSPSVILCFQKTNSSTGEVVKLNVDFALYELIADMKEGYRPTVQDKNHHTDFVSFIQQVIEFGSKEEKIIVVPKMSDKTYKMIFEKNEYGDYEFKVV